MNTINRTTTKRSIAAYFTQRQGPQGDHQQQGSCMIKSRKEGLYLRFTIVEGQFRVRVGIG